jgi:hypothetical protein
MRSIDITRDTEKTLRERLSIPDGVTISFAYEEEYDLSPEDSFCYYEAVQWVWERIEQGNDAAWFMGRITVTDGDAIGEYDLGGCSYRSFEEFMTPDDYFGDMVTSAYDEFKADVARLAAKYAKATTL